MKLLLDTNAFFLASLEPERLSSRARDAISNPFNKRWVSVASLWEMQIKYALGKLPLPASIAEIGPPWTRALGAQTLPIEVWHLGKLYDLPHHHRDPFDRLLIAQALSEGMEIVSADAAFKSYSVPVIW